MQRHELKKGSHDAVLDFMLLLNAFAQDGVDVKGGLNLCLSCGYGPVLCEALSVAAFFVVSRQV